MSRLLNSGRTGSSDSFKDLKKLREETVNKWNELGLLEGIGKGNPKMNIVMLLESDAVQFLDSYEPTWCVFSHNLCFYINMWFLSKEQNIQEVGYQSF